MFKSDRQKKFSELESARNTEKKNLNDIMEGSVLRVRVLEAKNLEIDSGKDLGVQCFIKCLSSPCAEQKTKAVASASPVWNEQFEMYCVA